MSWGIWNRNPFRKFQPNNGDKISEAWESSLHKLFKKKWAEGSGLNKVKQNKSMSVKPKAYTTCYLAKCFDLLVGE